MIDPKDFWATAEQVKAHQVREYGKKKPRPRQETKVGFLKVDVALWHRLVEDKSGWKAWAMVGALYEAWFTTGIYSQHPNPFPLARTDSTRWGLNKQQKYQALKFLIRIRLIDVDRSDPKNPLVTLAWVPRYSPRAS